MWVRETEFRTANNMTIMNNHVILFQRHVLNDDNVLFYVWHNQSP